MPLRRREQTGQVATAITEMTATVQEVASNANSAAESAQQADDNGGRTGQCGRKQRQDQRNHPDYRARHQPGDKAMPTGAAPVQKANNARQKLRHSHE